MKKHQITILIALILLNAHLAGLAFAQTNSSASMEISCLDLAQFVNPAQLQDISFGTIGMSINTQNNQGSIQPAIEIIDFRTGDPGCGENPVTLTVQILNADDNFTDLTTNRKLFNGVDEIFEPVSKGERAAALSLVQVAQPICTGCTNFAHTLNLSATQALSSSTDEDLNPFNDGDKVGVLLQTNHGFYGTATVPAFSYSLEIPPAAPLGSFSAILTYTLTP